MKTITINDDGTIHHSSALTVDEQLNVAASFYWDEQEDNNGQIIFYTGLVAEEGGVVRVLDIKD